MVAGTGVFGAAAAAPAGASSTVVVNCPTNDLQAAINAAAPGSTIVVTGTCVLGELASFSISKNLTLVGPATLEGNRFSSVLIVSGGAAVVLNSITIVDGGGAIDGEPYTAGAGITNGADGSGSSLTLNRSTVTQNFDELGVGGEVGGIYNDGTLILNSSSVTNNTAYSVVGGIPVGGIVNDVNGNVILNQSSVSGNLAEPYNGVGGILNVGTLTLNKSTVSGNTVATYVISAGVGGISGPATLNHSSVTGNTSPQCDIAPC
jgi:hypothetical protein